MCPTCFDDRWKTNTEDLKHTYWRHVKQCKGPRKKAGFPCDMCGTVFPQIDKLKRHSCTKLSESPEDTYVRYTLKPSQKAIIRLASKPITTAFERYESFFQEKWSVPSLFPPLTIPRGGLRNVTDRFHEFGNVHGSAFIADALEEKFALGLGNIIKLDKSIHIVS